MVVGNKKYGLQWRIDVSAPWRVLYHGSEADWCHLPREDMVLLYRCGYSVAGINEWMSDQISKERYCKVGQLFSELELL